MYLYGETENPAKGHFEKCVFSRAPESSVLHLPLDELARASEMSTRLSQHQRVLYVCGVLWPPRSGKSARAILSAIVKLPQGVG